MPNEQARQAERKIGNAFDERQRERGFRRKPHQVSQQDESAFLDAETARDRERGAPDRIRQALDDDCLLHASRVPHQFERNQDFERADQPSGHVHRGGRQDAAPVAPDQLESFLQAKIRGRTDRRPSRRKGRQGAIEQTYAAVPLRGVKPA